MKNQQLIIVSSNAPHDADVSVEVDGNVIPATGAEVKNGRLVVTTGRAAKAARTKGTPVKAPANTETPPVEEPAVVAAGSSMSLE